MSIPAIIKQAAIETSWVRPERRDLQEIIEVYGAGSGRLLEIKKIYDHINQLAKGKISVNIFGSALSVFKIESTMSDVQLVRMEGKIKDGNFRIITGPSNIKYLHDVPRTNEALLGFVEAIAESRNIFILSSIASGFFIKNNPELINLEDIVVNLSFIEAQTILSRLIDKPILSSYDYKSKLDLLCKASASVLSTIVVYSEDFVLVLFRGKCVRFDINDLESEVDLCIARGAVAASWFGAEICKKDNLFKSIISGFVKI